MNEVKLKLEPHPVAQIFPMMSAPELQELTADIREHGLLEPLVTHEERILDGRNRLEACTIAGVRPTFTPWSGEGGSPLEYVIAKNLHRRHLTVGQRAALAAEMLPHLEAEAKLRQRSGLKQGDRVPVGPETDERGRADEKAAELAGVGRTTVAAAKAVRKRDPETFERLRSGELNVSQASRAAGYSGPGAGRVIVLGGENGGGEPRVFGKGDKWEEATEPLARYLASWKKRDYAFAHVNPREARKRLGKIDRLLAALQAARTDLETRSLSADGVTRRGVPQ